MNWYLTETQGDIQSLDDLADVKLKVEKIIEKLVHHVSGWGVGCSWWIFQIRLSAHNITDLFCHFLYPPSLSPSLLESSRVGGGWKSS